MWIPKVQIKGVVIFPTGNQATSKNLSFVKALFLFSVSFLPLSIFLPGTSIVSVLILADHFIIDPPIPHIYFSARKREELLSVYSCIPFVGSDHAFSLLCVCSNFVIFPLQKKTIVSNRQFHVLVLFVYQYNFEIELYRDLWKVFNISCMRTQNAYPLLVTNDICKFLYTWISWK